MTPVLRVDSDGGCEGGMIRKTFSVPRSGAIVRSLVILSPSRRWWSILAVHLNAFCGRSKPWA